MLKINSPTKTSNILSTIVFSVALIAPYYADAQSNYSYGGGSGGGVKCYKQVTKTCPEGSTYTTKKLCKLRTSGTLSHCTERSCSGGITTHLISGC